MRNTFLVFRKRGKAHIKCENLINPSRDSKIEARDCIALSDRYSNGNNKQYRPELHNPSGGSYSNSIRSFRQIRSGPFHLYSHRAFATWPKVRPRRIRVVTMDVTGTIVSFRGSLSEHYLGAAKKCGIQLPTPSQNSSSSSSSNMTIDEAFSTAYKEASTKYPCFGGNTLSAKEWWRYCVVRSFELVGVFAHKTSDATELLQQELLFQRVYSIFGSQAAYERFDDALPFLHWLTRRHVVAGVLSNADERYGDSILPMLGLTHDELQFQCFSKDYLLEKPDARFYHSAMQASKVFLNHASITGTQAATDAAGTNSRTLTNSEHDPLLPSQILHIGNDYSKDFVGARRAGMHAVLLDRYDEVERAEEWKRRGALVFKDLMDVVEFLGRSGCRLG